MLRLDTKDKASIISEEFMKTCLNVRFFSCYNQSDVTPKAMLRKSLKNSTKTIKNKIREKDGFYKNTIKHLKHERSNLLSFLAFRDETNEKTRKYLEKLSIIQYSLCQQIDSKPDYYPSPTIFRRREEARINEFILSICQNKYNILNSLFDKLTPNPINGEQRGVNIVVINEHINTTKIFIDKELEGEREDIIFLRTPYWFANFPLYHPVITHEISHFLLNKHKLMTENSIIKSTTDDFVHTFAQEIGTNLKTSSVKLLAENIIEEIIIDVISSSVDGFSYLIALVLSNIGQRDRFYLHNTLPQLSKIPWTIRMNVVIRHLRKNIHKKDQIITPWLDAFSDLSFNYYQSKASYYQYNPYMKLAKNINKTEKMIEELIEYYYDKVFRKIAKHSMEYHNNKQENKSNNCWNIKTSDDLYKDTRKFLMLQMKENIQTFDFSAIFIKHIQRVKPMNIPNLIALHFLEAIKKLPKEKLFAEVVDSVKVNDAFNPGMGRMYRYLYDYVESNGKSVFPDPPEVIYEVCFIKFRFDSIIENNGSNEFDCSRNAKPFQFFYNNIKQYTEELETNNEFYYCFGPFSNLLIRPNYSTKTFVENHSLDAEPFNSLLYFLERKIMAKLKSNIEGANNKDGLFDFFVEIRLKERRDIQELYSSMVDCLETKLKCHFNMAFIYTSLDWQDLIIKIDGAEINFMDYFKHYLYCSKIIERTQTTTMIKAIDISKLENMPITDSIKLITHIRVKSNVSSSNFSTKVDEWWDNFSKVLSNNDAIDSWLTLGKFDYRLHWKQNDTTTYSDIFKLYLDLEEYVSDIQTEIVLPV